MGNFLEYRGIRTLNREVFLLEESRAVSTFDSIHRYFNAMVDMLKNARTAEGKSHIASLSPMIFLMQRQFCTAFDSLSSFQAYEAWLILRPAVEIPLIVGKWLDNRNNVAIWKARAVNKKEYRRCYVGEGLRSKALPNSDRIQGALSRLNDLFVHPHPEYCYRHFNLRKLDSTSFIARVEYFDEPHDVKVSWLAMSHLMLFVQDRLCEAIAATLVNAPARQPRLAAFEIEFGADAQAAASKSAKSRSLLEGVGLWALDGAGRAV